MKRRFIRQNRDLARINATQAIQIRTIELEISRLLAENITLREKAIHDDAEILRLREKVEPEAIERPENADDEEQNAFARERREILPPTLLSPIVEDEEKSPVRLRSPITITRFRRPIRPKIGRRKSASLSEFRATTAEPQSPQAELDFTILSPDSPERPLSPLIASPARSSPRSQRSPFDRSPIRSIHVFQSESPPFRQRSPSKQPTIIERCLSPLRPSPAQSPQRSPAPRPPPSTKPNPQAPKMQKPRPFTQRRLSQSGPGKAQSPKRNPALQTLSPNKPHPSVPKVQKPRPISVATPSPIKRVTPNPARSVSVSQKTPSQEELSGQENATHARRRRDSKIVTYAEPSLRKKMRRQSSTLLDAAQEGSMVK